MTTTSGDDYEKFRAFPERAAVESLRSWLEFKGVPSYVQPRTLASGLEADFVVFVTTKLAHRARWIVAQLPPSDAELEFFATGKLPGQEEKKCVLCVGRTCPPNHHFGDHTRKA